MIINNSISRLFLVGALFITSQTTLAQQQFQWTDTLFGQHSNKISIDSDAAGNVYLTRNTTNNFLAIKISNGTGTQISQLSYAGCTPHSVVIDIEAEADGSAFYVLTLETGETARITCIDEFGFIDWSEDYGNSGTTYLNASPLALNNNRLMLGVNSLANIHSSIILDIDKTNGNVINSIHQKNVANINSMDLDNSNSLYVTGNRVRDFGTNPIVFANDTILFNGDGAGYNFYAAKYDANNENIWANVVDEHNTFIYTHIESDELGNAYLTGELLDILSFGTDTVANDNWVYDFFLTKIDASGNFVWAKNTPTQTSITGDVSTTRVTDNLTVTPDGFASLSTVQRGLLDWGNGIVSNTTNMSKYLLCIQNYDPNGVLELVTLADTLSYNFTDYSGIGENAIVYNNNGDYYVAGNYRGNLVLGVDSFFVANPNPVHQYITKIEGSIASLNEINLSEEIILYPNPVTDKLNIEFTFESKDNSIDLLDNSGKIISNHLIFSGKTAILDMSELEKGIYQIRFSNGGVASVKRVIKL